MAKKKVLKCWPNNEPLDVVREEVKREGSFETDYNVREELLAKQKNSRWQYNKHFTSSFFVQKFFAQHFCAYNLGL